MSRDVMDPAAVAFRFLLASILLVSGLAKLPRRTELAHIVDGYRLVPAPFIRPVAAALAPLEVSVGLLLAVGLATRYAAAAAVILVLIFTAGILVNLVRGREIDCGCFGLSSRRRIGWGTVGRNLALGVMAMTIAIDGPTTLSFDSLLIGRSDALATDDAVALALAATLALATFAVAGGAWRLRTQLSVILGRSEAS